jgi:mannose-1-phosphate guanylyltransferase/mannose-6-phosphate isomerase
MALIIPVILCGGSGARLWPLSRAGFPKQFLVLSGDGSSQSLFQQAVARINSVANAGNQIGNSIHLGDTLVVTNEDHRFLVLN